MPLKSLARKYFSISKRMKIKSAILYLKSIGSEDDLNKLATIFGTDKWGAHFYTQHYDNHFRPYKNKKINLLEIGVGGYKSPVKGGESLKMWKRYFHNGKIFSLDIFDKSLLQENRIRIFKGSQVDKEFLLNTVVKEMGEIDLIVDDGSHINEHVIETFKILFPILKVGGIYVVEDVQTSYWPRFGGDSNNLQSPNTMMNFFKQLTDCVNYVDVIRENYEPSYYDKHITSIHFYHNMIFIYKGLNDEPATITDNKVRIGE